MKEEIAVENLMEIKDIFDENGIGFWLDSGTLLGAVRNGKLIEWDEDIDLGTWYNNIQQIVSTFPELVKRRFDVVLNARCGIITITRSDCKVGMGLYNKRDDYAFQIWFAHEKKIADILHWYVKVLNDKEYPKFGGHFFPKKHARNKEIRKLEHLRPFLYLLPSTLKQLLGDIIWLILDIDGWKRPLVIPKRHFERLTTIKFYGTEFNVPSDLEKYLQFRYGNNWKTPNKKWTYYKDDGAISPNWRAHGILTQLRY